MAETATAPRTRKAIAGEYSAKQTAIKALETKGIDNLTEPEVGQLTTLLDERDGLKAELDKFPAADAIKGRVAAGDTFMASPKMPVPHAAATKAQAGNDGSVEVDHIGFGESELDKFLERGPFKSFGHLCYSLYKEGGREPGRCREGILGQWNEGITKYDRAVKAMDAKATATGLSELADSEGASFVPLQFAEGIWKRSIEQENLFKYLAPIPVAGNSLSLAAYADDDRTDGKRSGGVQGFWTSEASQYTKSKPGTRKVDCKLSKLTLLIWATQELLDDSPQALDAEITRLADDEFTFKCNDAVTRGGGVGIPLGYLNAPCKVTTTAVSGQGANTIVGRNIDDMWARRSSPTGGKFIWIGNQNIEPQLAQLNYSVGTSGVAATWLYLPAGGITNSPNPQLKGRPLIFTEQAEGLGTEGDLTLIDFSQWVAIVKSTGIRQSISSHLRFDFDELAFKFSFRADARPRWEKALTRFKGSASLSPIITLNSTRT